MKASIFTLFLFSVLLATSEVTSVKSVKLCGHEYARTVVHSCASSRWRRHLEGPLKSRKDEVITRAARRVARTPTKSVWLHERRSLFIPHCVSGGKKKTVDCAERENYFQLPNERQVSEGSIAHNLLKVPRHFKARVEKLWQRPHGLQSFQLAVFPMKHHYFSSKKD